MDLTMIKSIGEMGIAAACLVLFAYVILQQLKLLVKMEERLSKVEEIIRIGNTDIKDMKECLGEYRAEHEVMVKKLNHKTR